MNKTKNNVWKSLGGHETHCSWSNGEEYLFLYFWSKTCKWYVAIVPEEGTEILESYNKRSEALQSAESYMKEIE